MEFLQTLMEQSDLALLTALILGLMTAISPCPMATNITAIGFISRDIQNQRRVFINGLIYTLGRSLSYTALGLLFYFSVGQFALEKFFQNWGERILGPVLIIIALFMLGLIKLNVPGLTAFNERMETKARQSVWGVLLLGILFALAFCPYSGVLFFGLLIPMTISSPEGLFLPFVFALGTGFPVIIFAWIIAFSVGRISGIYKKVKVFEFWFRRMVAFLFLGVGIYYLIRALIAMI